MYMKPRPANPLQPLPTGGLTRFVIGAAAILIVALGLFPDALAGLAQRGAAQPVNTSPTGSGPIAVSAVSLPGSAPAGR
jgi:hypothetical protein